MPRRATGWPRWHDQHLAPHRAPARRPPTAGQLRLAGDGHSPPPVPPHLPGALACLRPVLPFKRIPFWVQILAGLVLGVALGLVARSGDVAWLATTLTTVGELFVQLLKLAVPPLVFTAVVASIANLRGVTNAARLAGRTLLWFMVTSLIAVVVGLGLGLLTNPGRGVTLDTGAAAAPEARRDVDRLPHRDHPDQPGRRVRRRQRPADRLPRRRRRRRRPAARRQGRAVPRRSTARCWSWSRRRCGGSSGSPRSAPRPDRQGGRRSTAGTCSRRSRRSPSTSTSAALIVLVRASTRCCCSAFGRLSPLQFFAGAWPAIQLAFVSRSSVGTMPLTQQVTVERLGVPEGVRLVRGAVRRHDQDGRLRRDLPGARGDLRRPGLRRAARRRGLPADRVRLGGRLGGHRRPDRRDRHADADAQHAGPAAGRRRAAAGRSTRSWT